MASVAPDVEGGHNTVADLAERCSAVLETLRDGARSARADERREPTFPIGRAAELVSRTTAAAAPDRNQSPGRIYAGAAQ